MRALFIAFAFFISLTVGLGAQGLPTSSAQGTPTASQPSANDLHEFTRLLGDARIQDWIKAQASQADEDGTLSQPSTSLRDVLETTVDTVKARIAALGEALPNLRNIPAQAGQALREQIPPHVQLRGLTFVIIFLFMGAGLEWLIRQYTGPLRQKIELTVYDRPIERVWAAFMRAGLALVALMAFALASIGTFAALQWPPLMEKLVLDTLLTILAVRAFGAVLVLLFAPFVPRLRLAPMSAALARALFFICFVSFALAAAAVEVMNIFPRVVPNAPAQLLGVEVLLAVGIWIVALGAAFLGARAVVRLSDVARAVAIRWRLYLNILASVLLVLWLLDVTLLMWSVLLLGLLVPALRLLRGWVDACFEGLAEQHARRFPRPEPVELEEGSDPDAIAQVYDPPVDPAAVYRPIVHRLVRFGAIIATGLSLALLWQVGLFETAENPTVLQRAFGVLVDSAAALLLADLVWVWAKTTIDTRVAAYKPPEDGAAPGPEARMATLLPLLRVVLMVTLLAVVIMSILSSAGVNIAPLLAGASVLGIAIGFGAQSLVRDVVSGIFFLVDDAFRVGEYVEIDQLRGTVEKISIRSLQLRHHRGAVHTLPFGELKSLTNHSRDWVIMKLEFRVPFDTDLKLVKKLIKQVGARLKENPDYGDGIIQTLKSQGVRRMEEFNMVVGVKFMTRPGEQWLVRRDAYQFVRDIFEENGIRMAERNVKVEIAGGEDLSEEERRAVSGAAQESINKPVLPGVIPDEP